MNLFKFNKETYSNAISKKIAILGFLTSIVVILNYLSQYFIWPLATFLNFDLSIIPIIVALFIFDIWMAALLIFIRTGFELLLSMKKLVFWYGPLMQAHLSIVFIIFISILYFVFKRLMMTTRIIVVIIISTFFLILYATLSNWLWSTPLYISLISSYKGSINPYAFNDFYVQNKDIRIFLGGWSTWHSAAWGTFGIFNLVKFSIISIVLIPILKVTTDYFNAKK